MDWHKYFTYDAKTGDLIWKRRSDLEFNTRRNCAAWNTRFSGRPAGSKYYYPCGKPRAIVVAVPVSDYAQRKATKRRNYPAHRIIWEMHNGSIPDKLVIDHINCNPLDNRLQNLRIATHSQNNCNRGPIKKNPNKVKGVRWHERGRKWNARIRILGREISLGLYESIEDAASAYAEAAAKYHGEFARHKYD